MKRQSLSRGQSRSVHRAGRGIHRLNVATSARGGIRL